MAAAVATVRAAGALMLERFDERVRTPDDRDGVVRAIYANDEASLGEACQLLQAAPPQAGWVEDELEGGALPAGEW